MKPTNRAWRIRQVGPGDEGLITGLLSGARWQHRHLDWVEPQELLGHEPFLLASEHGIPLATLACPPDPPGVAWIRLFAVASGYDLESGWHLLWNEARALLEGAAIERAAALCIPPWLPKPLERSDFQRRDSVVFMEWTLARPPEPPEHELTVAPLLPPDLTAVAELDRRAFQPLWRHSPEALSLALEQSAYARVVRAADAIAGYQICTTSAHGGHLARLAVDPDAQGQGLATLLVTDVLHHFYQRGVPRVTVNTQGSNERGQALYQRLGFQPTGQEFPVYQLRLAG